MAPCDPEQPGLEAGFPAEAVEAAVREEKGVLCRVFRIRMRSEGGQRRPVDRSAMPVNQFAERGRVALPGPGDQVDIAHTDYRHASSAAGWVGWVRWGG